MKFILPVFATLSVLALSASAQTYQHRLKVKDAKEREAVSVKIYADKIKVEYLDGAAQKPLEAKLEKGASKRKYRTPDGKTISEVKLDGDDFKIRDASAKLQWKIKSYPDGKKLKISDNEENKNPFELKNSDDGKQIKVLDRGTEVAAAKFYPDTGKLKLKDAKTNETKFEANAAAPSRAVAVLALEKVPLDQRVILAAELVYRERQKK